MSKTIGGIGSCVSFVLVLVCWCVLHANKSSQKEFIRDARQSSLDRMEKQIRLSHNRSLFSNALFRVSCGMDRNAVYEEFIFKSGLSPKDALSISLRDFLWAISDISCAITNYMAKIGSAKNENINSMINEEGGLNLPHGTAIIKVRAFRMMTELDREMSNVWNVVFASSNKIAEVSRKNNSRMGIEKRLDVMVNGHLRAFHDLYYKEANLFAKIGVALSMTSSWRLENGIPVCNDENLYAILERYSKELDVVENQIVCELNALPIQKTNGPFERNKNSVFESFVEGNKKDISSLFGIKLGSHCAEIKGGVRKTRYNPYAFENVPDRINIEGEVYQTEIMSMFDHGYSDVKLRQPFHTMRTARINIDKSSKRVYEIVASGPIDTEEEFALVRRQIEEKFGIKLSGHYRSWEYRTEKYGKVLRVERVINNTCEIRLTDLNLKEEAVESQSRSDVNAL